ncbi:dynein regulatory complex protein 1 isoform X2 [Anabas testudineus]|uniref:dynein regulatory complex protein 1 isoform X2 n=1 Tax=Anabas testudineus TaxID=64144 RepID=UPI000E454538|nr:dynein regulatory complex protein 1 isoform X2 [Anabas testudineus]
MEEVYEDPAETSEHSVLHENQEVKNRQDDDKVEEDPSVEVDEEPESQPVQEEVEEGDKTTPQRIINLQKDLTTLVTNIQTAADAKESMRRTELEEARRIRLERLENNLKSSQEQFEEIARGWAIAKDKVIPQELHEALKRQQQLCSALLDDKRKLISDLQQELKVGDDRYVKDLRKQAEELDLMMERMEEQIKTLTKAYREEVAQIERIYQQENEVLLTRDKTEWEKHLRELWDKEIERLTQRRKKVEEYEKIIHNLILETINKHGIVQIEQNEKFQVLERKHHDIKGSNVIVKLKQIRLKNEVVVHSFNLIHMKNRTVSLQTEMKNLEKTYTNHTKHFTKRSRYLSEDYKRNIQQYERMQKKIRHFAAADAKKFEEMWLMIEAEVKQLVEKALLIDSLICKQHLGLSWERPPMDFMELSGPIQTQKQAHSSSQQADSQLLHSGQGLQCSQGLIETRAESTSMKIYKAGTTVQSGSSAEVEELSIETLKKVMELLCDEAGFLMEDKLLKLLAPLEKEEQTVVKLGNLISSFGIEEEDLPKLALFLLKYKDLQTEDQLGASSNLSEAVETSSTTNLSSDFIDPRHVLPALKSFLEQHMRESSGRQHSSLLHFAPDSSEYKAYWESMGNIISEDKVQLWEAAENTLKQYLGVLTDISELIPETESLKQQNTELRMLLQQSLNSRVCVYATLFFRLT